ncbi:MAG: ParB N-terminal domain-containing protein, partial [Pyrinomonadaceae bacterium]|nr:ParB N-terminal domain-containing protein [Pyrinomonadaceae bacterium]
MSVNIEEIKVSSHQRRLREWKVQAIAQKMRERGYNASYPITIDADGYLVDGGHRLEAAKRVGLTEIPSLVKPQDVASITHGIRCNEDGADTERHDVFDYAELCWTLTENGNKDDDIAKLLGWNNRQSAIYHRNIKTNLHSRSWKLVAEGVTGNSELVTPEENGLVTLDVTKVTPDWKETHFRAFLKELPCPNGDRAMMRAQVRAISELISKPDKLTAKVAGDTAARYAWYTHLAKLMTVTLVQDVGVEDRKTLLRDVYRNVYGKTESDRDLARFIDTLRALNERAHGIKLYQADALQYLPTLPDKSIALVVTDPPYNTTEHEWDEKGTSSEFLAWTQEWLQILKPKLKDEFHLFVFCDPDYFAPIEMMLRADGWPIRSRIIWEYRNLVKGRDVTDKFIENYQVCLHCGTHALNWPPQWDDSRFMVQEFATPQSNFDEGRHHPTSKPVAL